MKIHPHERETIAFVRRQITEPVYVRVETVRGVSSLWSDKTPRAEVMFRVVVHLGSGPDEFYFFQDFPPKQLKKFPPAFLLALDKWKMRHKALPTGNQLDKPPIPQPAAPRPQLAAATPISLFSELEAAHGPTYRQ